MNLKNTLKITMYNYTLILKSFFYNLIIFLLSFFAIYLLLKDFISTLFSNTCFKDFFITIKNSFNSFIKGKSIGDQSSVSKQLIKCIKTLFNNVVKYRIKIIFTIIIGIIYKLLCSLDTVTTSSILNKKMSVDSSDGYCSSFVRNLKKAFLIGLINVCYSIIYNALSFSLSLLVTIALFKVINLFALPFIIFFIVLLFSLKKLLFCQVVPYALNNEKILKPQVFKFKNFNTLFLSHCFISFISIILIVLVSITTFFAGTLIVVAFVEILYNSLALVTYYHYNNYNYYISTKEKIYN